MSRETTRDRQRIETGKAAFELAQRRAAVRRRTGEPPRPGDVFAFRQTADYPVEWAVVEARPEDGRLLVVPLDDDPLVGSRDVELAPEALGGVANLRCDLDAWLDASEFDSEMRTGMLPPEELERVRRKRQDVQAGVLTASLLETEVDGDPEYQRWRQTLRDALAALPPSAVREAASPEESGPAEISVATETGDTGSSSELLVTAWWQRTRGALAAAIGKSHRRWLPTLAFATTALLAVALPVGWKVQQLQRDLRIERQRSAGLASEGAALKEQLETSTAEARRLAEAYRQLQETSGREIEENRSRVEELKEALKAEIEVNLPTVELKERDRTRSQRGVPFRLGLPAGARRLALSVEVVDPEPYPRYRLRIVEKSGGGEIWRTDELFKMDGRWLRLDLPTALLDAGEYQLLIYGLAEEGPRQLEERYSVKIERRFER